MDINELTIGQAKELAALFAASAPSASVKGDLRYVIVRARDAGVHFGKLVDYEGRTVRIKDARRIWRWKAAKGISLSECAEFGIEHINSKISCVVTSIIILDAAEIIDCSEMGSASITAAPVYTP
jgi:hypothetical protein